MKRVGDDDPVAKHWQDGQDTGANMSDLRERLRRLNLPETVRTLRAIEQDLSDEGDAKGMRTIRQLRLVCQDELQRAAEMPS